MNALKVTTSAVLLAVVSACSSDACDPNDLSCMSKSSNNQGSASDVVGIWNGTSTGPLGPRDFSGVVLENGAYWLVYTTPTIKNAIDGFVQGTLTAKNGVLASASTNGVDLNFGNYGANAFSMTGTYVQRSSITYSMVYAVNDYKKDFNGTYNAESAKIANLANIAGTYTGTAYTGQYTGNLLSNTKTQNTDLVISATGGITGTDKSLLGAKCNFTGGIAPHREGNVYDVSITFGGGGCENGTSTLTGVGYFDSTTGIFTSPVLDGARTKGFVYQGKKQ